MEKVQRFGGLTKGAILDVSIEAGHVFCIFAELFVENSYSLNHFIVCCSLFDNGVVELGL